MTEYQNYPAVPIPSDLQDFSPAVFREPADAPLEPWGGVDSTEHELLAKVYTELGFFNPDKIEEVKTKLHGDLAAFREQHPGEVQPLIAVPLAPDMGLRAVVSNFDQHQRRPTRVYARLWDQYTADVINRRSIDGRNDPRPWSIIGMPLVAKNASSGAGLTVTDKRRREQRYEIGNGMVANAVDWIALAALNRERGYPLPDGGTITCFPQMSVQRAGVFYTTIAGVRYSSWTIGSAYSGKRSRARLHGHGSETYGPFIGVRRLVGEPLPEENKQL